MKYLIFGTGDYYERYKAWFDKRDVAALLDNAPGKQNTMIDGIRVMAPAEGVKLTYDCVVILSFYVKEMRRQLTDLGVAEDRIYHFYDLHRLFDVNKCSLDVQCFGASSEALDCHNKNRILLLSQDLTFGGPALALFHMAIVLQKQGHQVVYASMLDGPLKAQILDHGIPVVVDRRLQIGTMRQIEWTDNFSIVVCNTINFHVFLSDRDDRIPVIWWLHDSLFFYDGVDRNLLHNISRTNLHPVSVGSVPSRAIQSFLPSLPVGRLLYGVEDVCPAEWIRRRENIKVVFVTIGYIEARKGQDILVQALKKLPDEMRQQAVFYLVGQDTSLLAQDIRQQIRNMPEIMMTGTVGRVDIDRILDRAHMLICPSREDPMPTVAAEAMMHGVPCLLSDAVGTAEYICHRVNGLLFENENAEALADEIAWCITHCDRLSVMGLEARKLYEELFSVEAFESSLSQLMEKVGRDGLK